MKKALSFALAAAYVLFCSAAVGAAHAQDSCADIETVDVQFEARAFPAQRIGDAVLFHAGMYIDADGAPNAYGPHNRGLDFTAKALRGGRFLSVGRAFIAAMAGPSSTPFRSASIAMRRLWL